MMSLTEYTNRLAEAQKLIIPALEGVLAKREQETPGAFLSSFKECMAALELGTFNGYQPENSRAWEVIAISVRDPFEFDKERLDLLAEITSWLGLKVTERWTFKYGTAARRDKEWPAVA